MKKKQLSAALLVIAIGVAGVLLAGDQKAVAKKMPAHAVFTPADIQWVDGSRSMPPGAKVALLEGDPTKPGYFAMRVKVPDGYTLMPHWHPNVERFTVISGTFHLGLGATFSKTGAHAMIAGSYGTVPPKVIHYGWAEGETEYQITTLGPLKRVYVNPADDPGSGRHFGVIHEHQ